MTTLNELAKILKCHPRTILRAMTGKKNPYWVEGYDITLTSERICQILSYLVESIKCAELVLGGKDEFLKPDEAAAYLGIHPRTFRYRKYEPIIRFGKIVRYSKNYLGQFIKLKDVL